MRKNGKKIIWKENLEQFEKKTNDRFLKKQPFI